MAEIINVTNLTRKYGETIAVNNISFSVEEGEFFAFLGVNGAGKSTTINMLCTFLKPDAGTIKIGNYEVGRDDDAIRKMLGVVFQEHLLDESLSVYENLKIRGSLYGMDAKTVNIKIDEIIELFQLQSIKKRSYGQLSGGQKRRCDIARALIHNPKILILDEPTTGLDPQSRKMIWEIIHKLRNDKKMTVFLTTHYMEEVLDADNVNIIDEGQIKVKGTPGSIREKYSPNKLIIKPQNKDNLLNSLRDCKYKEVADTVVIDLPTTLDAIEILRHNRSEILSFEVLKGSMDDAFINITGKEIVK